MIELGTPLPGFDLPCAVGGRRYTPKDFAGSAALLVMFICNHCPFVKHVRGQLALLGRDYSGKGLGMLAINSNDTAAYPDDSPEKMKAEALEAGYTFPYLFDESQAVAKAFGATCTPDFFLYDGQRRLVYRGQLDDSRPSKYAERDVPVTGRDLRAAIDAVLAGRTPAAEQRPSMGCNIKWKPGNEPASV
jgi:thiol-disulfide isomerase/thioredoxin